MTLKRRFRVLIVATAVGSACPASASVNTYTDRATWTAANGAPSFSVDFESFAVDTSFADAPLDVGPFSLSTVGTSVRDFVDVFPFELETPASFGNAHVEIYVEGPLAADLTFDTPVRGFFADFFAAGNGTQLKLTLSFMGGGTADVLVPGIGNDLESFGFDSTDLVSSIRFNNSINDGFSVDNIEGGVVPEPASVFLIGAGLIGLGRLRRK